jgi:hypothetical protein
MHLSPDCIFDADPSSRYRAPRVILHPILST